MIKPSILIKILEGDSALLDFTTKNQVLIWPLVRHDVISFIVNSNNHLDSAYKKKKVKFSSIARTIFQSIIKTPLLIRKNQFVFFNSGITNIKYDDGLYFNRVSDPFYFRVSNNSSMIEDTAMGILRTPRIHKHVYPHFFLIGISKILGVFKKVPKEDLLTIERLTDKIISILDGSDIKCSYQNLYDIQINNLKRYYAQNNTYTWFFRLKKPKAIFLEDASYCNKSFILIPAKKRKIPVIELQHGFVNEDHIAYNLGAGIRNSEAIKLYYPDYFFAYGDFWKQSINPPCEVISIGNPYLTEQINKIEFINQCQQKTPRILFLSSGVSIEETVGFLKELKEKADLRKYELVLRPHPLEVEDIERRYSELIASGLKISVNSSLYADFVDSDIIIGETSTALFESLAVKNKKQFLFMSSYTKSYFNENIKIEKVYQNTIEDVFIKSDVTRLDIDYFWKQDWERNFDSALAGIMNDI